MTRNARRQANDVPPCWRVVVESTCENVLKSRSISARQVGHRGQGWVGSEKRARFTHCSLRCPVPVKKMSRQQTSKPGHGCEQTHSILDAYGDAQLVVDSLGARVDLDDGFLVLRAELAGVGKEVETARGKNNEISGGLRVTQAIAGGQHAQNLLDAEAVRRAGSKDGLGVSSPNAREEATRS
jgi:hypothetical protein